MSARTIALLLALSLCLGGCSLFRKSPPPEAAPRADELGPDQKYLFNESVAAQHSTTTVGRFNAQMIFLGDQLERNTDRRDLNNTFIVTSFTTVDRMGDTSSLGRLIAENLIHELQVRRWKVYDLHLAKDLTITEQGDFSLSRELGKLREKYEAGGVVTGTYAVAGSQIVINARVVDLKTGMVESSAQAHLPLNAFTESLLNREEKPVTMKVVDGSPAPADNAAAPRPMAPRLPVPLAAAPASQTAPAGAAPTPAEEPPIQPLPQQVVIGEGTER